MRRWCLLAGNRDPDSRHNLSFRCMHCTRQREISDAKPSNSNHLADSNASSAVKSSIRCILISRTHKVTDAPPFVIHIDSIMPQIRDSISNAARSTMLISDGEQTHLQYRLAIECASDWKCDDRRWNPFVPLRNRASACHQPIQRASSTAQCGMLSD